VQVIFAEQNLIEAIMKRTRIILPLLFISFFPFSLLSGQEKKNEEKIKIVIADKSGTNVIIDTTFTSDNKSDSIKLNDGTIVYIGKHPDEESLSGNKRIYIKSPDDKNAKKITREVTVISSDSDELAALDEIIGDNVVVYSHSGDRSAGHGKSYKVITHVGKDAEKSDMKYIYINDDKEAGQKSDEKFDIRINEDEFDHDTDNTKHVIAKNGVVVTIEGSDEAKINELVKEIEKSLDINNEKPAAKPAVK
jgi:preprotein translocase subunit YajC